MRVLIDTNILIDWIGSRAEYSVNAMKIANLCAERKINGCIAAHSVTNLFYIMRKELDFGKRKAIFEKLSKIFTIMPIDYPKLLNSTANSSFSDFEDCLQMECAKAFGSDYIITRNVKDFINSDIQAIEPQDFLAQLHD